MEYYNCSYGGKLACIIEVIISIIIGVIVGVLFANSIITALSGFIGIALIVSAIGLAVLIGSLFAGNLLDDCKKNILAKELKKLIDMYMQDRNVFTCCKFRRTNCRNNSCNT